MVDRLHNSIVNIIQWNSQSLRPKSVCFELLLFQEKIHIAVVSETWLEPGSSFSINSYNCYRLDRADSYGGVAIFTHKSVKTILCSTQSPNPGIELLHVRVLNCQHIENIISIYCPSTVRTSQADWDYVFSICSNKSLILGDFNGHHSNWSNKTDVRGNQVIESMLDSDFIYLNDGSPTRVKMVNNVLQQSSPDISFASSSLALNYSWTTTNESLGSDHLIIKISCIQNVKRHFIRKRNYKKSDWSSFRSYAENEYSTFIIPDDPQMFYDRFVHILENAADAHIPYVKIPQNIDDKFVLKPYWCVELSKAVAERRLALANLRRCPSPENLNKLKMKISDAQRLIRKARCNSWHSLCSSVAETTSASEMWRKMRWIKGRHTPRQPISKESAEKLLNDLTPDFVNPPTPMFCSRNPQLESDISIQELQNSIKRKDTAPGCDEISFSMIQHLPLSGKLLLLRFYNLCYTSGFVPLQWRNIKIIPIPKNSSSAFRPISLISCVCKILHSILNKRLEWYFEKQHLFPDVVVGFRKTRSCLDNLTCLTSHIQLGFAKDLVTVGCFIDVTNAYNNVDVYFLINLLEQFQVGSKMSAYLWSFLSSRVLTVNSDECVLTRWTGRGLAQGDPMSPLLFNVATVNICKSIQNVEVSQYADDFVIYITKKHVPVALRELKSALHLISDLLRSAGLEISPNKSKICVFKKGSYRSSIDFEINNCSLQLCTSVKYLGLWLDSSLRWGQHVNETVVKVQKLIRLFKVLSGSGWGMHQKHLRRLYISIIRSRIDYASFLYDNSCQSNLIKLDRIQNQVMRVIGGFIRSTPIHVMENELCLPPLFIRRRFLAGKFWLKAKSFANNRVVKYVEDVVVGSQARYWTRKKMPVLTSVHSAFSSFPIHACTQLEMFSLQTWMSNINIEEVVKVSIPTVDRAKRSYHSYVLKNMCLEYIEEKYHCFYKLFTDGSKDGEKGGAAFLDSTLGTHIKLKIDVNISIMHIELIAIAEALSYINSVDCDKFVIFSDSKSALQHISRCIFLVRGVPIVYSILESILNLHRRHKTVCLQWIPSHIQLDDNEEVDLLAKQASVDGIPLFVTPLHSDYVRLLKIHCTDLWQEYFDRRSAEKGIWYRTIQPQINTFPWIDQIVLNRKVLVTALRLRSGHVPTNKFAFLMKKVTSPNCEVCGTLEDVYHVLMECVRNANSRTAVFNIDKVCDVGLCNSMLALPLSDEAQQIYCLADQCFVRG